MNSTAFIIKSFLSKVLGQTVKRTKIPTDQNIIRIITHSNSKINRLFVNSHEKFTKSVLISNKGMI